LVRAANILRYIQATALIRGPPQVLLLAIDTHIHFINVESVTVVSVLPLNLYF
jgi:hypothetical protein